MRITGLAIALITLAGAACFPADDFPILVYPSPRAGAPPKIDGVLDDACWKDAPLVTGFMLYDKPVAADVQTAFQVTYDDTFLYVGIECDEPEIGKVPRIKLQRDDHSIFGAEAVEVFIDPRHDHQTYYQLAVNAAGSLFDGKLTDPTWNAAANVATQIGLGQWFVELAIPWADLEVTPQQGTVLGLNVCRDRLLAGRTWSNWAQTTANFHDPLRFGHLVLSPTPEQLGALGVEFREGDRTGPIQIFTPEGVSDTSYRELAKQALARVDAQLAEIERVAESEKAAAARDELRRRIQAFRDQLEPRRSQLRSAEPVDAVTWARTDRELSAMSGALTVVVWEARLSALLSGI